MRWQPIETAPKDGRTIIAIRPTTPPHVEGMYWVAYDPRDGMGDGAWHWHFDGDCPQSSQPTHWMPLPPPPKKP